MNKLLFSTILLVLCIALKSQDHIAPFKINDDKRLYLSKVIEVEGSADDLMKKSEYWIARAFTDGEEVKQVIDNENNIIIGKGISKKGDELFYFTLNIYHKKNKARLVIDQIYIHFENNPYAPKEKQSYITWYYKKGDVTKKPITNRSKIKKKRSDRLVAIINDWAGSFESKTDYSDF